MHRVVFLVSLLVLGSVWILRAAPVLPDSVIPIQENFDLARFMGKWYEIAVVSTCPHYMQRKREDPVIVAVELQHVASEDNFTVTACTVRNDSCAKIYKHYGLTNTSGRFFYHVAKFQADVDSFVVRTNYDEYAMTLQLSTEKPSGNITTIAKIYSRTKSVSAAVMDDFKTLVKHHGMSDDAIIVNENKENTHICDCLPDEPVLKPITTQHLERNTMPPVVAAQ